MLLGSTGADATAEYSSGSVGIVTRNLPEIPVPKDGRCHVRKSVQAHNHAVWCLLLRPNARSQSCCAHEEDLAVPMLPFQKEGTQRDASNGLLKLATWASPGLAWMCHQEDSDVRGGILADEMGMGKTIQAGEVNRCPSRPR